MRIYYIFNIRKEYVNLYKDSKNSLYKVLYQLYYLRRKDAEYGFNMFKQLTTKIDDLELDKKIFIKMHNKMTYVKKGKNHIINNLYKEEITVLKVKKSYILINCNKNYTEFFNVLASENKDFFVCDFINNDYFFLRDIKMLV